MKDHFFKNITIEIANGNKNRYNAVLDVCRQREYPFEEIIDKGDIEVLAYFTPKELGKFFFEVDTREEELKNIPNVSLTEEQKAVVAKVMDMLADANIGLCHDYKSSGQLMAFNSVNGKVYAYDDISEYNEVWYSGDDIIGEPTLLPEIHNGKQIYSFYRNGGFAIKK